MRLVHKKAFCKLLTEGYILGDRAGIRTQDPQLRRLLLYPAELPDHPLFGGAKVGIFPYKTNFCGTFLALKGSEGITHGKVEGKIILEVWTLYRPTTRTRLLRIVCLETGIQAQQEEIKIHTQTQAVR